MRKHLGVAQLGARELRELQVAGSIPATQIHPPVAQSVRGALLRTRRLQIRVLPGGLGDNAGMEQW